MQDRPPTALVRRARAVDRILQQVYPDAHCELDFGNPYELLVATILSAQCTDERVNQVTPVLFAKYPDPAALAAADRVELEEIIRSTGFFRNKAASLQAMAVTVCDKYRGEIPRPMSALVTLPGVGRKTAHVVRGNAFDQPGFTVDTHVTRLSQRLGWTEQTDPVRIEYALDALFPRKDRTMVSHRLIFHGRRCCFARRPACAACPVARLCPSRGIGEQDIERAEKMIKRP
ncbi:MAG TPA: endonuclease III [Actinomycetota bacterium]|nr:endonuclease III [Actinomycetota bacterium]